MKYVGCVLLCVAVLSSTAFVIPPPPMTNRRCAIVKLKVGVDEPVARGRPRSNLSAADPANEPDVTVFDAEGGISWEDYKKEKPAEYKLNELDEMQCWKNDECPVEDEGKFTKAWKVHSAERNPRTETHFDSEGEWEEESVGAWAKAWYEDVGEDDLHEDTATGPPKSGYDI